MKVNKFVKKYRKAFTILSYYVTIIQEALWDIVDHIPIIGNAIIQDFYPFVSRGCKPRWKWYEVFTLDYWRYSFIHNVISDINYHYIRPAKERVQKFIVGKTSVNLLDWLVCCNDSKLLEQDGWSACVRSRG